MMVTILQGEEGAFIALSSHSFDRFRPKEAWKFTQWPSFDLFRPKEAWTTRWTNTHKHTLRDRMRERHLYDRGYSRLYDIKGPIITRGKAVLCMIGRRSLTMSGLYAA